MSYYDEMVVAGRERDIGRSSPQHFANSPNTGNISFGGSDGRQILTITHDGKLIRGEGFDSDHAATVAFLDVLAQCLPCFISELRARAECAEAELAKLKVT